MSRKQFGDYCEVERTPGSMIAKISAVINTLNEEANIADCIRSVQGLADEIVVCDMHSDDCTVEIAQNLGARVILIERMEGKYQMMRYLGVQAATHEWVLAIDADERMTETLAQRLREVAQDPSADVVRFGNLFWYFGGWVYHGFFFTNDWPRFFRRRVFLSNWREGTLQAHNDWEALDGVERTLTLPLDYHLLHYAYPTVEKYVWKTLGMYARVEAEQYRQQGRKFSFLRLIGDPFVFFWGGFLLRRGYRDGIRGFILTVLYAVYRFTIWANLWLLEELERQKQTNTARKSDDE